MIVEELTKRQLTDIGWQNLGGALLADWLNAAQHSKADRKIGELLQGLNRFFEAIDDPTQKRRPILKLYQRINRQARRYKTTLSFTQVWDPARHRGKWRLMWAPARARLISANWPEGPRRDPDGHIIMSNIVRLSELGLLERLRRCVSCAKWLFASKRDQRFCRAACRQKYYQSDPEVKQRRRERMAEYMRDYRAKNSSSWRQMR